MTQPNNQSTKTNPVGRFMVAAGAVITQKDTGKILINQRASTLDWRPNDWEIIYGRIDQHESLEDGLRREVKEEVGITDLEVQQILRAWHIYRGTEATAQNDLIGVTYWCETTTSEVTISSEHQAFRWVSVAEALDLITTEGIRLDLQEFQRLQATSPHV